MISRKHLVVTHGCSKGYEYVKVFRFDFDSGVLSEDVNGKLYPKGALIMAGAAQQENAETRFPQNRLFIELFAVSFIGLAVLGIFGYLGLYGITINIEA